MLFGTKSYLKSNRNNIPKHPLQPQSAYKRLIKIRYVSFWIDSFQGTLNVDFECFPDPSFSSAAVFMREIITSSDI